MTARISVIGARVGLHGPTGDASLPLTDETRDLWRSWVKRYRKAVPASAHDLLRPLGLEIYAWLNSGGWAQKWLADGGARQLEIAADAIVTDDQRLLLSLPWELLGNDEGYFAENAFQPFEIWRRIGPAQPAPEPPYRDLSLLFMAASPRGGGPELDFELEEAAILSATEKLELSLAVEESGCADYLEARLRQQETFEAMHFSCHGDVLDADTAQKFAAEGAVPGPNLLLEAEDGSKRFVPPERLAEVWENDPPQLVFLSACRTSEAPGELSEAFSAQLARGVPAVLGWDGSVNDPDAIAFAEEFYGELAAARTSPQAVCRARRKLLSASQGGGRTGLHWHLARLWLGGRGGGALCSREGPRRQLPRNAGYKSYLDDQRKLVQVAGPLEFVGRRRFTQDAIKVLRDNETPGLLLFGMGNLGKSSLAARVANRLPHLKSLVIFQDYDATAILEKLVDALKPEERAGFFDTWKQPVQDNPSALAGALESLLKGQFFSEPILLIIDDLEQVLEDPEPGQKKTPLKRDYGWSDAIAAVLSAFRKDRAGSRLLFTSRYDFSAVDAAGEDLALNLNKIQLTPFTSLEREKQWRAELSIRLRSEDAVVRDAANAAIADERCTELLKKCLASADGNPGLQDILTTPLLASEFEAVQEALEAIEQHMADPGAVPEESNKAFEFFRRMTFAKYREALSRSEFRYLSAISFFGEGHWPETMEPEARAELQAYQSVPVPVPEAALTAVAAAAAIGEAVAAKQRLIGLGLLEAHAPFQTGETEPEFLVNRFARPIAEPLSDEDRESFARAALPSLEAHWAEGEDKWPQDGRSVEALRLALIAGVSA
ncbi:CHAT domain-containing protein [Roseibium sp.]|uniref:CHAT domain-containing protein n=1 Tax=Roseibium sp. TaxID=1936156 RepID=UPI003BAEAE82